MLKFLHKNLLIFIPVIIISIIIIVVCLLCIKNETPIFATTTTELGKEATGSDTYNGSTRTGYCRFYFTYDDNFIYSISSVSTSTGHSPNSTWLNCIFNSFTVNLGGATWKAASDTTFRFEIKYYSGSVSDSWTTVYNNAINGDRTATPDFKLSGNTFSLTTNNYSLVDFAFSNSSYRSVMIVDLTTVSNSTYIDRPSYRLTFDYNGGSGSTASKSVTANNTIGTLPDATRDNYIFEGWSWNSSSMNKVYETDKWIWTNNRTAYAQWTFDGYTLASSVDGGVGGSIIGASSQYPSNSSVTVTASAAEGYAFDHWVLNGTATTANPLTFTITQNSTLVAYFREIPNVNVTIRDNIPCDIQKTTDTDCFIVVTPPAGQYVNSFVIDGMTFSVQYYHANIYGAGEAHLIHYTVRDTSNTFSIYFEQLFGTSSLEIVLATVAPNYQTPPLGGASIEGVATQATNGGEARITGIDTTEENATVHVSAVCYNGYAFAGWTASDGTDLSSYGISADIPFDLIEGKVITANFVPNSQAQGNNTNDDLDNIGSEFG